MLTMMSFGAFTFRLPTVVYQDFAQKRSARFALNPRLGAVDAFQFTGPGPETVELSGVTAFGISAAEDSFAQLSAMMGTGEERALVDGLGTVFGQYVLLNIDIDRSNFARLGQARRSEFSLQLERVDDPRNAPPAANLPGLAQTAAQLLTNPLSIARFL